MLDQVTGSASRAVCSELWPAVAASGVPERMATAHGVAMGRQLRPWVALGATGLAVGGGALLWKALR